MTREELVKLGWKVRKELIDKSKNEQLFIVENPETDWAVLYFYTDPDGTPMVECFYDKSMSDYFYYFLHVKPKGFLKDFQEFRIYNEPDWFDEEENWVREQTELNEASEKLRMEMVDSDFIYTTPGDIKYRTLEEDDN